jgi:hypothetical protein
MKPLRLFVLLTAAAPFAHSADTDSIESVVKAVYQVISGPAGARDWAHFRTLFADGARLIPVRVTPDGPTPSVLTPEEYIQRTTPNFEKNGFFESPVAQRVETFGNIAHVFSTYESRRAPGEKPFARGINSFQLVRQGSTWKVMTILWDSEREGNPIPEKYLK